MYSVRDVARMLRRGEPWVRKWIGKKGLGHRIGHAVILNDSDLNVLKGVNNNGHEGVARSSTANHQAV